MVSGKGSVGQTTAITGRMTRQNDSRGHLQLLEQLNGRRNAGKARTDDRNNRDGRFKCFHNATLPKIDSKIKRILSQYAFFKDFVFTIEKLAIFIRHFSNF
ncbi:MAG: hypothetical protein V4625_09270 [Pseudomonadota bacterium]